jgi:transcription antitermination factor NusG
MASYWYALRSKPRKEIVVWRQILAHSLETFFPCIKVNPVNPRSRKYRPYFPGYLFVKADIEDTGLSSFKYMPHTLGLVCFDGEPAVVPENLIHEIGKRVEAINKAGGEVFDGLEPGDRVHIKDGPFKHYQAIFDTRLPGSERVRVLLELLGNQRQIPVELSAGQIEKKRKRK